MNNNVAKCISKYKKGLTVHLLQHESTVFPILLDQNTTLVSSKSIKLKVKMFIVIQFIIKLFVLSYIAINKSNAIVASFKASYTFLCTSMFFKVSRNTLRIV